MRKWCTALLLVGGLALSLLNANPYVSLGVGGNAALSVPFEDHVAANFHPSLETRMRVMWFDFDTTVSYTELDDDHREVSAFLGVGVCNRDAEQVRLGVEMGPRFRFIRGDGAWCYEKDGDFFERDAFVDSLAFSPVTYRCTADWLVDNHVAVGLFYQVDTAYRFDRWERMMDLFDPEWDTGLFGVSVLYYFHLQGEE